MIPFKIQDPPLFSETDVGSVQITFVVPTEGVGVTYEMSTVTSNKQRLLVGVGVVAKIVEVTSKTQIELVGVGDTTCIVAVTSK